MPANLPYPLQFDPSQWKNPYTKWAGQALPFYGASPSPAGEFGGTVPTDAMGNPIQSYTDAASAAQTDYNAQMAAYQKAIAAGAGTPGTTLNNTGGSAGGTFNYAAMGSAGAPLQELMGNYQAAQAKLSPQQLYDQAQTRQMDTSNAQNIANLNMNRTAGGGFGAGNNVINTGPSYASSMQGGGVAGPPLPAPPQAPQQPDMTAAYIKALQNPGHITTPGATVAQSAPPSQQSNVLQNFLANWNGNTKGAGNYDNSGFFGGLVGNV